MYLCGLSVTLQYLNCILLHLPRFHFPTVYNNLTPLNIKHPFAICVKSYFVCSLFNFYHKCFQSFTRDQYIRQLIPNSQPVPRINVHLFGHSGVGKSTLIDSLKTGYFSSFFRRNKSVAANNYRCEYMLVLCCLLYTSRCV